MGRSSESHVGTFMLGRVPSAAETLPKKKQWLIDKICLVD